MTTPPVPNQLIPTLSEVVPLEGARSIAADDELLSAQVQHTLDQAVQLKTEIELKKRSPLSDPSTEHIADEVLLIVKSKLAKILPDLLHDAVDEVLNREIAKDTS
jgi:hypothetical protein